AGKSEARFFAEARITAQLAHPAIVPVYAMGWLADGRPYYTMKLIEGEKLEDLVKNESGLASRRMELLQIFARICQAIAFAHSKGVIHRDLKPNNILVGVHGEVQVIDFGVAKVLDDGDILPVETPQTSGSPHERGDPTQAGKMMGTLRYMPP